MTAGDRLIIVRGCSLRKPKYRTAYLQEFNVAPRDSGPYWYMVSLWVEALCRMLQADWRRHGRAHW